jgi:hypothetical protein
MSLHSWCEDAALIADLANGRLPEGVRPDTAEGRHYRRIIDAIEADIAKAPPPTEAQLTKILPILRGGDHAA